MFEFLEKAIRFGLRWKRWGRQN